VNIYSLFFWEKEVKTNVPKLRPNQFNVNSIVDSKLSDIKKALIDSIKVRMCLSKIKATAVAKAMNRTTRTFYNRLENPDLLTLPEIIGIIVALGFTENDYIRIINGKAVSR
jgi:hypothetical protein